MEISITSLHDRVHKVNKVTRPNNEAPLLKTPFDRYILYANKFNDMITASSY